MHWYRVAAEAVVLSHAAYIAFVVFGLVAIVLGLALGKPWARNFWFRTTHLVMIGIVAIESWLGLVCPLTTLEKHLRRLAGESDIYQASFIESAVHRVIFFQLPPWVFAHGLYAVRPAGTSDVRLLSARRLGRNSGKRDPVEG